MNVNSLLPMMMLMAKEGEGVSSAYFTVNIVLIVLIVLCALFMVFVVLLQPGNSSGLGAFGGGAETFFGKNKAKTLEGKMKPLTVVVAIVLALLLIGFALLQLFPF